jgi:VWFA-related protein
MRARLGALLLLAASANLLAQGSQTPVFRSGVELLEVDVSVVDDRGRPVTDLRGPEFAVTIDGEPRKVVTLEYLRDGVEIETRSQPDDPYIVTNANKPRGRLIIIVVDQNSLVFGRARDAVGGATRFLDKLLPSDRVALMAIPAAGPAVNFTNNHDEVRAGLARISGGADLDRGRFELDAYEALALDTQGDQLAIERVIIRVCGEIPDTRCIQDVFQEAAMVAQQVRRKTEETVSSLSSLLRNLRDVEGTKHLILLSQGLNLEGTRAEAVTLAQLAAEARVNVNVVMFEEYFGQAQFMGRVAVDQADRQLREQGLEMLAGASHGALFRVPTSPDLQFDRLASEMSGHYMLGVEPGPQDRDGRAHQIRVEVRRQGLTVRSRREVRDMTTGANAASRDKLMVGLLTSPFGSTDLPLRLSTYVYKDAEPAKVQLIVASEIIPLRPGQADLEIGFVLFDRQGNAVLNGGERKIFVGVPNAEPLRYDVAVSVDPGVYRLRFGVIDEDGNRGSVEKDVQAWQMAGDALNVGDLMLSEGSDSRTNTLRPPVNLQIDSGHVAAYLELYSDRPEVLERASVFMEIAEGEDSPALLSGRAGVRPRENGSAHQVFALMPVGTLPPGRYLARAMIYDADQVVGKLVRPFVVAPGASASVAPAAGPPAAASVPGVRSVTRPALIVATNPARFTLDDVLTPEYLRGVYDIAENMRPGAKGPIARARAGRFEGTALLALESGDQTIGAFIRGIEVLLKRQLDPAAVQFDVALKTTPAFVPAAFYLGACYAAAGRDNEAVAAWERVRASQPQFPLLSRFIGYARLRLGQTEQALEVLQDAAQRQPADDDLKKNLGIVQAIAGHPDRAYATLTPYLATHPTDQDALLVVLQEIYLAHAAGRSLSTPEQDRTVAAKYAQAYISAKGPYEALVTKWMDFLREAGTAK